MNQPMARQRPSVKKIAILTLAIGWMLFLALVFVCNIWIVGATRSQVFTMLVPFLLTRTGWCWGRGN